MELASNVEIEVHLEDSGAPQTMGEEVLEGLSGSPKQLPSKYFYDERGSRLFERITELPEYYLTRAESALLERHAARIAELASPEELVELGSGSEGKIRRLIDAALRHGTLRRYVPVEVSQDIVEESARALGASYPQIEVHAFVGDFEAHLCRVPGGGRRLVAFLGSTIGNFREEEAVAFLTQASHLMEPGDSFLLGTDLVKDTLALEAAYNDSEGVTAEFNRNILNVVNRHLGGNFDPGEFEHVAFYNEEAARIESYLRSNRDQCVRLDEIDFEVPFAQGEMLWTEVSCKYTRESVARMLARAGLYLEHWFASHDFALSLSRLR